MTTAFEPDIASIEHLDHSAQCEFRRHTGPPRAYFWLNAHGCDSIFACHACAKREQARVERLMSWGIVQCAHCVKTFFTWEDFAVVVPI